MALRVNGVSKVEAMIFKPDTAWAKIHASFQVLYKKKKNNHLLDLYICNTKMPLFSSFTVHILQIHWKPV